MTVKCCWLIFLEVLDRRTKSDTRFRFTDSVLKFLLFQTKMSNDPK